MSNHFESLLTGLKSEGRQEISTIPERFVTQALKGDWDGVAALYHPAAIQMPPDQPEVEGRKAIRDALSRTLGAEAGVRLEEFSVNNTAPTSTYSARMRRDIGAYIARFIAVTMRRYQCLPVTLEKALLDAGDRRVTQRK